MSAEIRHHRERYWKAYDAAMSRHGGFAVQIVEGQAAKAMYDEGYAQAIRDVYWGLYRDENHHRKTPIRSMALWFIERFAKQRGIDLDGDA